MATNRHFGPLWKAPVVPTHRRMEHVMSLDIVLKKVQSSVPECLAAGVVDMETGAVLAAEIHHATEGDTATMHANLDQARENAAEAKKSGDAKKKSPDDDEPPPPKPAGYLGD